MDCTTVTTDRQAACASCGRKAFVLRAVESAKFCDSCAQRSARIDRKLAKVHPDDPVYCDGCGARIAIDARIVTVMRECGGVLFCGDCSLVVSQGAVS